MSPHAFRADRRRLLGLALRLPLAMAWVAPLVGLDEARAAEALLAATASGRNRTPTPECGDADEPTPAETAGPFFKPSSPERTSLLDQGMSGTRLELSGRVFGRGCRPLGGALLDFWHADTDGEYDLTGFTCRGHQFSDNAGPGILLELEPNEGPAVIATGLEISGNTIVRNAQKPTPPKRAGIVLAGGQDGGAGTLLLTNNVIRDNGGVPILETHMKLVVQASGNVLG